MNARGQRDQPSGAGVLAGQRVALAGAGGTLGSALAARLVAEGADVVLGDLDAQAAAGLAGELAATADGNRISHTHLDVTERSSVDRFVAQTVEELGGVDIYLGNAGILSPSARIHNVEIDDLRRVLEVNLIGGFNGMQAVLPIMRSAGSGRIVLTASVAGLTAWSHTAPYCVSKAALVQLVKVAAAEYAREGIRVNCVCPGTFRTAIHDGLPESALNKIAEQHAVGRLGGVNEIVGAFIYLADPASSFTTGTALVVDGGYSC